MEELRSTEILDKEIQEDARKKAQRILTDADAECRRILDDVENRIASVKKEKTAIYEGKLSLQTKDAEAAVPLEKERFLVSFEGEAVTNAIKTYLDNLPTEKKIILLQRLLTRYKSAIGSSKFTVRVHGYTVEQIQKLLNSEFESSAIVSCAILSDSEAHELDADSGIIIETVDRAIRCRVTVAELVNEILDKYSYELASTLFGGSLPQ